MGEFWIRLSMLFFLQSGALRNREGTGHSILYIVVVNGIVSLYPIPCSSSCTGNLIYSYWYAPSSIIALP